MINDEPPSNKKNKTIDGYNASGLCKELSHEDNNLSSSKGSKQICEVCLKEVSKDNIMSCNKGKTLICKSCFKKLF